MQEIASFLLGFHQCDVCLLLLWNLVICVHHNLFKRSNIIVRQRQAEFIYLYYNRLIYY